MTVRAARIRYSSNMLYAAEIVGLSGIGDLMVVDDENVFIGVLSEGDILRTALPNIDEILAEGGTVRDAFEVFLRKGQELASCPIAPVVIQDPIVVSPDEDVAAVTTILLQRHIGRLPVVEDGKLVGTVSRADICRAVVGTL
ncbi:MAG: CBS domain-containing protein [Myxococcales bacterium]|nr:CBS domain-containing protein [Myxococcales bacterium]MCB9755083.1 CBS domain-containing protein [Myxococcales bacterium]